MAKEKDHKWKVVDGTDTFTVTRKGSGHWDCDCTELGLCKHIKIAKLQRELRIVQGRAKKARPKKKKEKIVYHFHHLAAKVKEMLLTLQLQDVSTSSWTYKDTATMIDNRDRLSSGKVSEWNEVVDKFRDILPGLTKKRLRQIKDELQEQKKKRSIKNRGMVWQQEKENTPFPERLSRNQVTRAMSKVMKRLLGPTMLSGEEGRALIREDKLLHYSSRRICYGINNRRKIVVWLEG